MISGSNNSLKPFGMVGYSGLNGIVYRLMLNNNYANRKRIYSFVTEHITKYLTEDIVTYLADKHSYVLLAEFSDVWKKHWLLTRWFHWLFSSIDKLSMGDKDTRVSYSVMLYSGYCINCYIIECNLTILVFILYYCIWRCKATCS